MYLCNAHPHIKGYVVQEAIQKRKYIVIIDEVIDEVIELSVL